MPTGIYDRSKSKTPHRCPHRSPHSEETKRRISVANTGKKRTPQQIQNIKDGLPKNRKLSNEHKHKISISLYGKRSRGWKGGRYFSNGYKALFIPNHPMANKRGYVLEHRYIASKHLGRPLFQSEIVHHINENKLDNRIENLIVFSGIGYHKSIHKFQECLKHGIILYLGKPLTFLLKNTK